MTSYSDSNFKGSLDKLFKTLGDFFIGLSNVNQETTKLKNRVDCYEAITNNTPHLGRYSEYVHNGLIHSQGATKRLTAFFTDIRGFTAISEKWPPEIVMAQLNEYFALATRIVCKYNGTPDKFIGDGMMAFFGAPIEDEYHAYNAIKAAIEIIDSMDKLNVKWQLNRMPSLHVTVGINTGTMIVGNLGSNLKMEYTAIGDNVNLAARIQEFNKEFNTRVLISENTYNDVQELIKAERVGCVKVRGRENKTNLFVVNSKVKSQLADTTSIENFQPNFNAL